MKVLYVEDNTADADLARRELAASAPDIELEIAGTLRDAGRRLDGFPAAGPLDVVLADLRLPDGSAIDLASHLHERRIQLPLVVITGAGGEDAAVAALKAGAEDYLTKRPGYLRRLSGILRDVVRRRRADLARFGRPLRVLYAEHSAVDVDLTNRHFAEFAPFLKLTAVCFADQVLHALTAAEDTGGSVCDVLLLDFHLPGMNAIELTKEVRQTLGLDLPIVLVTGHGDEELAVCALKLGATDYVSKGPGYLHRLPGAIENAYHLVQLRREAAALRESELRYRSLFESAPVGIWTTDAAGRYTAANAAAMGWFASSPIGRTDNDLLPEEAAAARIAAIERVAATGSDETREETIRTPKGPRTLITRSVAMRDAGGAVCGVLSTGLDITGQKSLEAQLIQAQKMEGIGRLAGGVAHDFNNLLTIIGGYVALLRNRSRDNGPDAAALLEIQKAAGRAASLTRQLLAFSRRQVLQLEATDLNTRVRELANMLRRLIGEDVKLVTALAPDIECVLADATQIDQVLINLAVNARDAMPLGGVLTIETSTVDLGPDAAGGQMPPGRYVRLAVADTGVGMDRETMSHIFEPFFTTKEPGKGTGLGLSTVYGIVRQSQGHIAVRSEPRAGTVVEIFLPVTQCRETGEAAPAPVAASLPGGTILVAEDDEAVRKFVAMVLRDAGFDVIEASTAAEALRLCEQSSSPVRLLITDIVLPGASGVEIAWRAQTRIPATKVLYISGYSDDRVAQHGIPRSGAAFLQKPFSPDALLAKVREVLNPGGA